MIEGISLKENLLLVYKINSNLKYNEKKFDELTKKMNLREVLNKKLNFFHKAKNKELLSLEEYFVIMMFY